ncbi:MAG: hypothetical protein CMJ86_09900 [Planctomycetes bacterium]|nr:hypothetical protein [Planctomycetota bacterium]
MLRSGPGDGVRSTQPSRSSSSAPASPLRMIQPMKNHRLRVMCVSSSGGHLVQLKLVLPAFAEHDLVLVSTGEEDIEGAAGATLYQIPEASRWSRIQTMLCAWKLLWLIWRLRPSVIVSTGAAPGFLAVRIGRFFGARTVWLDSVANVEVISLAGQLAQPHCDLFLTQWPALAVEDGIHCAGGVL